MNERHNAHPWAYTSYFIEKYGTGVMAELFNLRNSKERPTNDDLKFMLSEYRQMLKEM